MSIREQPQIGEPFRFFIEAGAFSHRDAIGTVRIRLPDGILATKGELERKVHVSDLWMGPSDNTWNVYLTPTRAGKYAIRGWIRVQRPNDAENYDEMESRIDLEIRPDTVIYDRWSRGVRYERRANGQLFRYGGEHMVLIDAPEEWMAETTDPIEPAQLITPPKVECSDCELSDTLTLRYVVTVGEDGRVRWIEPNDQRSLVERRVIAAAEAAMKGWRFRPARIGGRPIAQWAVVDVEIRPRRD